jgi:cytochrome c oxidase subunit II
MIANLQDLCRAGSSRSSSMNALMLLLADEGGRTFWLPEQASEQAADIDWLFWLIFYLCTFFFVIIIGAATYFSLKYRRRRPDQAPLPSPHHNTPLEVFWTAVPLVLVIYIFYVGFDGYMYLSVPPRDAYVVEVIGQKWSWQFRYPTGDMSTDGKLHVPPGEPVKLVMAAQDVLHSFYIPDFRVKQDLVPGRFTTLWFTAKTPKDGQTHEHHMTCAEYCGDGHSAMLTKVVVHPTRASFDKALESFGIIDVKPATGERIYKQLCASCHNIEGPQGQGPNWKDLAKRLVANETRPLANGPPAIVDEEYVRESIMEPQAKVAEGFQPVMPTFKGTLKPDHISAIILYMKSLAQ